MLIATETVQVVCQCARISVHSSDWKCMVKLNELHLGYGIQRSELCCTWCILAIQVFNSRLISIRYGIFLLDHFDFQL